VVLVDTSVWIEVFRTPSRLTLASVADIDEIVTCLPVIQEVLQGFRGDQPRAMAKRGDVRCWLRQAGQRDGRLSRSRFRKTKPQSRQRAGSMARRSARALRERARCPR